MNVPTTVKTCFQILRFQQKNLGNMNARWPEFRRVAWLNWKLLKTGCSAESVYWSYHSKGNLLAQCWLLKYHFRITKAALKRMTKTQRLHRLGTGRRFCAYPVQRIASEPFQCLEWTVYEPSAQGTVSVHGQFSFLTALPTPCLM